jgi:hypothetical protein
MISAYGGDGHPNPDFNKSTQENWGDSPPRFLTAYGSFDTHAVTLRDGKTNTRPQAGQPYESISWAEIRGLVATPAARPKNSAQFVILSTYTECDGRTHKVQRELGQFWGLAVDIDAGNPPLSAVEAAVRDFAPGAAAIIYSSSSASPENHKWRVLIALHSPLAGADYPDTQRALFELLESRGLRCDITLARAGQPIYLPNVPPKRRAKDGRPLFYQLQYIEGRPFDLSPGAIIVEARAALRARRTAEQAKDVARAVAQRDERLAYVEATGDDFEPISHFKANHTVAAMLALYGFKESQRHKHHYSSPLSESGSYSTEDYGDYWVTVSAWAHNHNVGQVSANGNRFGDAFDLFAHFEYGGDRRAAVRAYSQAVRPKRKAITPAEWRQKSDAFQLCLSSERADLADKLGVAETALTALHCGWSAKGYWTFPVRDGNGNIVGISTRLAEPIKSCDGKVTTQKMIVGSRYGLFYAPEALAAGDGPILLVKGVSDTAAAYTMGLAAVGRPSNTGGVDFLAELLRDIPTSRPIIVIGENDERDGKIPGQKLCPGKNGAIFTAKKLVEEMNREVAWTMPPAGVKDTREYLHAAAGDAGPRFVELLLAEATTISPANIDDVERMPDRGPARSLDEWRKDGLEKKITALEKPGFYLDRGDVGTGKTKSMIDAIKATGQTSILWITPDHANCKERERELNAVGIPAIAYPRLDEKNCENIAAVKASQAFGLVAGAAVCPGCPFRKKCQNEGYLAQKKKADKSTLRISTISRAQASDATFREHKTKRTYRPAPSVIIPDERAGDVLAETIKTTMPDLNLARHFLANVEASQLVGNVTSKSLLRRLKKHDETHFTDFAGRVKRGEIKSVQKAAAEAGVYPRVGRKNEAFAQELIAVIDVIKSASRKVKKVSEEAAKKAVKDVAAGGVCPVKLPAKIEMPKRWQATFNEWVQTFKTQLDGERLGDDFAAGIRLITLAAAGDLRELWVMGERKIVTANGKRIVTTQVEVMGKRLADIPENAKVFLLDADATAADLAARTGRKIEDITPAGHIPFVQKVRQVPIDVTKGQAHTTTAKIIEAHLRAAPAVRRLGVIGHKGAIEAVFEPGNEYLKPWTRERVAMTAGYGTGPDRGSNLWTVACDDLAVIGTPRAPVVRAWLVAHGDIESASLPDGDWGDIYWEGTTLDGRRKVFKSRGFRHPAWRRAARAIHLAAIRQAAGRARAILPTGIGVTVYSDQPIGFPVDDSIKAALPSVHEAVDAVLWVMREGRRDEKNPKAHNGLDVILGDFALSPVRSPAVVDQLMLVGNIGRRAAQVKIDLAVEAGRLERLPGRMIGLALPPSLRFDGEASRTPPTASSRASAIPPPPVIIDAPVRPAGVVEAFPPRPIGDPVIVTVRLIPETAALAASIDTRLEYSAIPPPPRHEIEPAWTLDPSLETANVQRRRPR